ncbi:MAG: VOC family protein [Alphaproteobacteria bacterium]|nr:VOC family protein [Alphaproteobacteria bacterium]PHY00432.1 MAG: bleomycin resistance protein [Rhodospirillaceae bacterium]
MTHKPRAIGGLHEVCIGVPSFEVPLVYWQAFGFKEGASGALSAADANALYGVNSGLNSMRLQHQDADHGLIRLMKWDTPTNDGVSVAPFRGHGSRWSGQFARDILDIANHAAIARKQGYPVYDVPPSFIDLSSYNPAMFGGKPVLPFTDKIVAVREYSMIQPLSRQAVLERFGYDSKLLGKISEASLLRTSQIAHGGMMFTADTDAPTDFYDKVLGLKRVMVQETTWDKAMASRAAFDLVEGETHWSYTFEEPRSGTDNDTRRSGRLLMFRFKPDSKLADRRAKSSPGALGYCLFTWRVRDVTEMHKACAAHGCTSLTDIRADEFGTHTFTCITPDRFVWLFEQASETEIATMSV